MRDQYGVSGSWLWPGPALVIESFWRMNPNPWMEDPLTLSSLLSVTILFKERKEGIEGEREGGREEGREEDRQAGRQASRQAGRKFLCHKGPQKESGHT